MSHPQLRSSLVKEQLASVDELGGDSAAQIRKLVGDDVIAVIDRASRVDWLPMDTLLHLLDAELATLGMNEACAHWRRSTMRSFEIPLVKPFVSGVVSMLQPSPATVLPMLPKMWPLMYRHTGTVSVEILDDEHAAVVHREVPTQLMASKAWHASLGESYVASLIFLRAREPKVETKLDPPAHKVRFTLSWHR